MLISLVLTKPNVLAPWAIPSLIFSMVSSVLSFRGGLFFVYRPTYRYCRTDSEYLHHTVTKSCFRRWYLSFQHCLHCIAQQHSLFLAPRAQNQICRWHRVSTNLHKNGSQQSQKKKWDVRVYFSTFIHFLANVPL